MDSQRLLEIQKNPRRAREFAEAYKKEGKYAEALEMCEWFHFNTLSRPPFRGMRLSFALSDWMKLAEEYPRAKQRLLEIRDEEINRIKSGNWKFENFNDVKAISQRFKDNQTPVDVFKWIDKNESDQDKVARCFNVIFESLTDIGEIELCNKYLTDPLAKVKEYRAMGKVGNFLGGIAYLISFLFSIGKKKPNSYSPSRVLDATRRSTYIDKMRTIVKFLKLAKRDKDVEAVYKAGKGIIPDDQYQEIFKKG